MDCSEAAVNRLERMPRALLRRAGRAGLHRGAEPGRHVRTRARRSPARPRPRDRDARLAAPARPSRCTRWSGCTEPHSRRSARLACPASPSHSCVTGSCCEGSRATSRASFRPRSASCRSTRAATASSTGVHAWIRPRVHVEVNSTHCGMSVHGEVFDIVSRALRPRLALEAPRPPRPAAAPPPSCARPAASPVLIAAILDLSSYDRSPRDIPRGPAAPRVRCSRGLAALPAHPFRPHPPDGRRPDRLPPAHAQRLRGAAAPLAGARAPHAAGRPRTGSAAHAIGYHAPALRVWRRRAGSTARAATATRGSSTPR